MALPANTFARAVIALCCLVLASAGARAEQTPDHDAEHDEDILGRSAAGDAGLLDVPIFPGRDVTGGVRVQLGAVFAPETNLGSGSVSLFRPQLGVRGTLPVSDRFALRLSSYSSISRYRVDGDPAGVGSFLDEDFDLYATRIALEGAYQLGVGPWLADDESWSLLAAVAVGSRWEDGSFDSGVGTTGALGFGYEIPGRLRIGIGASLRTAFSGGDIEPGPFFSVRWNVTERLTLRSQGLGLRLEYELAPTLDLTLTATRVSDSFRLNKRTGISDDLSFRDRYLAYSTGIEWQLANWLHVELEVGGTAERHLRVSGDDLGTLVSRRADPSLILIGRLEIRL